MLSASRRRIGLWLLSAMAMAGVLGALLYLDYRQVQRQAEADIGNLNLIFKARLNATRQGFQASLQGIALRIEACSVCRRAVRRGSASSRRWTAVLSRWVISMCWPAMAGCCCAPMKKAPSRRLTSCISRPP